MARRSPVARQPRDVAYGARPTRRIHGKPEPLSDHHSSFPLPSARALIAPPGGTMSDPHEVSTGLLVRRRLLELLGNLKPWTVVSAPAGYGKSILVESWVAEAGRDVTVVRSA